MVWGMTQASLGGVDASSVPFILVLLLTLGGIGQVFFQVLAKSKPTSKP